MADSGNSLVRKISPEGVVSTLAGQAGVSGSVDGPRVEARLPDSFRLAVSAVGEVWMSDANNHTIRKISLAGDVVTVAGQVGQSSQRDGTGADARFFAPAGLAIDPAGGVLLAEANCIRKVATTGAVTTFAGMLRRSIDGDAGTARFLVPHGLASDAAGNLFVADTYAHTIRKITPAGVVMTVAGLAGTSGSADGAGAAARFSQPRAVALGSDGSLFVADTGNNTIRKINATGVVSTYAGVAGVSGAVDGTSTAARFNRPSGVAVDRAGNVLVADTNNRALRKIAPDGVVTTLAGVLGATGTADGTGATARFGSLYGLAIDAEDLLYVADRTNHTIRKVTAAGEVTTLAGTAHLSGSADGTGGAARFYVPTGVAVDANGNIFVTDTYNFTVRKITAAGVVTTLAGMSQSSGSVDGRGSSARFLFTDGIAIDRTGVLHVVEFDQDRIRQVVPDQRTPVLSWTQPAAIVYGTALSSAQLNATANVAGTWAYTPAAGTVLAAGPQTLRATFTPADPSAYSSTTVQVTLTVARATPVLTWAIPAAIGAGMPLSSVQLNAMTTVPGTLAYSPSAGTVLAAGAHPLTATFTPSDLANYTTATASVTLSVGTADYAGTYFGAFGGGNGRWALRVAADRSATFVAFLPERQSLVVTTLTVAVDGTFLASGTEITAAASAAVQAWVRAAGEASGQARAAAAFTLHGSLSTGGAVTGELSGLGMALRGAKDTAGGSLGAVAGVYHAMALGTTGGSAYAIVAPSGQALIVLSTASWVDDAAGTLAADGQLTTTSAGGGQMGVGLNAQQQSLSVSLTPAGATTPIRFAGLTDGVASTTRLVNLSVLSQAGAGGKALTLGFVLTGDGTKPMLVRAVGPGLASVGVNSGYLADPRLRFFNSGGTELAANDNWGGGTALSDAFRTVGAFAIDAGSADASLVQTLTSAPYTAQASAPDGAAPGFALVEAYDVATGTGPRLVNLSTLKKLSADDNLLIAGFVLVGNAPKTVLLRAVGPSLTQVGVSVADTLADPKLTLFTQSGTELAANDNWGGASALSGAFATLGAFAYTDGASRDAALLVTLEPGVYTAQVSAVAAAAGYTLVEIYEVP